MQVPCTPCCLRYKDIPWPPTTSKLLSAAAGRGPDLTSAEVKAAYRKFMLRWHPDKFAAKVVPRVTPEDRERVMQRVTSISKAINEQWSCFELSEGGDKSAT